MNVLEIPLYISIVGFGEEVKTTDPFLVIKFDETSNITIDEDGTYSFPTIEVGTNYNVVVDYENSNVEIDFLCQGFNTQGVAALPLVNMLFYCDFTSNY